MLNSVTMSKIFQMKKIIDSSTINLNNYCIHNSLLFLEYSNYYEIKRSHNNICNGGKNNIIYYKIHSDKSDDNKYAHDFLLTMYSTRLNLPILTSKDKYFKPFQYSIYDITIYKYHYLFKIIEETLIEKNSLHFLIDNNGKHIIRI